VVNKIDKRFARPAESVSKIESLFLELAANEEQLDFPVLYAVGRKGTVFNELPSDPESDGNVLPLLEKIIETVPYAQHEDGVFKMVVSSIDYDTHLGRISVGRVSQGAIKRGMKVIVTDNPQKVWTIEKLYVNEGLEKVEVDEAHSGEIVSFSGISEMQIGKTVSDPSDTETLPSVSIGEPTLHMTIGPNTSPFAGREGDFVTGRQIEERLKKELEHNLSLRVTALGNGKFAVSGRGELHLSILLETMRREGYEMEVGKPEVIVKEIDGQKMEPIEEASVLVPNEFVGVITEEMGKRQAKLIKMEPTTEEEVEFIYEIPTRNLIGLRSLLLTMTKGTVIFSSSISGYLPIGKLLPKMRRGALVASESGEALGYGLVNAQGRGVTFVDPATQVYEGMIIGLNSKDEDIRINVCKGKKLTNMRSKSSDGVLQLTPATKLSLEQSLDFLEDDELLEITPQSLRLRKKYLTELEEKRHKRQ